MKQASILVLVAFITAIAITVYFGSQGATSLNDVVQIFLEKESGHKLIAAYVIFLALTIIASIVAAIFIRKPEFNCPFCSKKYGHNGNALKEHMVSEHESKLKYKK